MRKFCEDYRRECGKKIDSLKYFIVVEKRERTKKEVRELIWAGIVMQCVTWFAYKQYLNMDESEEFRRFAYCGLFLVVIWMFSYLATGCLYAKFKTDIMKDLYIGLGYVALVFGGFISACLTLLELLAKRKSVYHLYKYFYMVLIAILYTMFFVPICWEVLKVFEKIYMKSFTMIDWNFAIWMFFYFAIKCVFFICLNVGCWFFCIEKEAIRYISDEMNIPFYMLLLMSMLYIWGTGQLENLENNQLLTGFLNASTVWLLYGTIREKVRSGQVEDV